MTPFVAIPAGSRAQVPPAWGKISLRSAGLSCPYLLFCDKEKENIAFVNRMAKAPYLCPEKKGRAAGLLWSYRLRNAQLPPGRPTLRFLELPCTQRMCVCEAMGNRRAFTRSDAKWPTQDCIQTFGNQSVQTSVLWQPEQQQYKASEVGCICLWSLQVLAVLISEPLPRQWWGLLLSFFKPQLPTT